MIRVPGLALALLVTAPVFGATHEVTVRQFSFDPEALVVAPGDTVIWKNLDRAPHTVTAEDGQAFASETLKETDVFTVQFADEGVFPYFCAFHPHMTGHITVKKDL